LTEPEVRAAGGLVVRDRGAGAEVAIVHRPRYDDWSLPKGKLEPGEAWEDAALREVEEETGMRCELGRELDPVTYRDRKGRLKLVRWWEMTPVGGEFEPDDEVDDMRWERVDDALGVLDYEHDRDLVRAAFIEPGVEQTSRSDAPRLRSDDYDR
jgi:8-oxo-dGTP diphosphatase